MGEQYPYNTIREKNIMLVLHMYGAVEMFLLFCYLQDTESESREMENGVAGPKYHRKNIKVSMGQLYLYYTRWQEILWSYFIFLS